MLALICSRVGIVFSSTERWMGLPVARIKLFD
jgi:hypothetical protein